MTMRRFTAGEEQALLFLLDVPGAGWRLLPTPAGPSTWRRLAALGLAQLLQDGPALKGRLTATGRYYATLLREAGLAVLDPPGMIRERTAAAG